MGLSKWIFYKLFLKSEIMRNQWPSVGLSSHGLGPATFGTQQGTFWNRIFGLRIGKFAAPTDFDIAPCGGGPWA